jgi:hypothetical protein
MERETIDVRPELSVENEILDDSFISYDLPNLVQKMKRNQSWMKEELFSMILLNEPEKQISLAAMHPNTFIKSFQSNESITLQLYKGKLRFHTRKDSVALEKGQTLTLYEKIKYNMSTTEETILLLTITKNLLEPKV